jgi:hypothetical protein
MKWALWFKMRVGKTPTSIRLANKHASSCIVICPKSLVKQWESEIIRWSVGNTKFLVVSKETFKKQWATLPPHESVVIDEVHLAFSNFKNKMFKAFMSYKKKHDPKCIWILTGTPYTSSSWSIYSYGLLLGKDWNWYKWKKEFFFEVRKGRRSIPMARTDKDAELQMIIRRLGTVIDLKDVADVPDDEDIIEYFSLNAEQKKLIKDRVQVDELPIVRFTQLHQVEQGVMKSDGYAEAVSVECDKDKRLIELCTQEDKVIIVCRYHGQIEKIHNILRHIEKPIYEIHGQMKQTASEIAAQVENIPSAIIIIQSATCAGYSLKSFSTMIFASMDYSYVSYDQMRSRIKSMDKTKGNTYIHMLTEGDSIDQGVFDCVSKKQDFSTELFANRH